MSNSANQQTGSQTVLTNALLQQLMQQIDELRGATSLGDSSAQSAQQMRQRKILVKQNNELSLRDLPATGQGRDCLVRVCAEEAQHVAGQWHTSAVEALQAESALEVIVSTTAGLVQDVYNAVCQASAGRAPLVNRANTCLIAAAFQLEAARRALSNLQKIAHLVDSDSGSAAEAREALRGWIAAA